jgi:hypothetical protein
VRGYILSILVSLRGMRRKKGRDRGSGRLERVMRLFGHHERGCGWVDGLYPFESGVNEGYALNSPRRSSPSSLAERHVYDAHNHRVALIVNSMSSSLLTRPHPDPTNTPLPPHCNTPLPFRILIAWIREGLHERRRGGSNSPDPFLNVSAAQEKRAYL